ncbi:MAG: transglutaminase family protein [Clostridia bacterium]|nr:transglutaminase family protein [Clostridia bacterium]
MEQYLQETPLLNFGAEEIQKLIETRGWKELQEFDKIKEIYNFVKDEIKLGYNAEDAIPASKVLKCGYGQCNTKATLLMALLRAVEVPCRLHACAVDKSLQKGALGGIFYKKSPQTVLHSWAEVYYNKKWVELEGVILDGAYLANLQKFYESCQGAFCGFAVSCENFQNPNVEFNGEGTFIQSKSIVEDYGVYDSPDDLYKEHSQTITGFKKFCYQYLVRFIMNHNVKRIRNRKEKTKTPEAAEEKIEEKTEE